MNHEDLCHLPCSKLLCYVQLKLLLGDAVLHPASTCTTCCQLRPFCSAHLGPQWTPSSDPWWSCPAGPAISSILVGCKPRDMNDENKIARDGNYPVLIVVKLLLARVQSNIDHVTMESWSRSGENLKGWGVWKCEVQLWFYGHMVGKLAVCPSLLGRPMQPM